MTWIKTFFEEYPGFGSSMRYIVIIGFTWLLIYTPVCVFIGKATFNEASQFIVEMTTLFLTGKSVQKHFETRNKTPQQ